MSGSEKRPPRPQSVLRHVKSALEEIVDTEDLEPVEASEENEEEKTSKTLEGSASPQEKTSPEESS